GGTSASTTVTVLKATSSIKATGISKQITTKQRLKIAARVSVAGVPTPNAKVIVRDRQRIIASTTMRNGKATLRLPRLSKGKHKLVVSYSGSSDVDGSKTPVRVVRVRR
ncbi:MAG: Ig-like domain repeat protein, partial [Nocardioides sp.]